MPMIKCPKCKKSISSYATNCIFCKVVVQAALLINEKNSRISNKKNEYQVAVDDVQYRYELCYSNNNTLDGIRILEVTVPKNTYVLAIPPFLNGRAVVELGKNCFCSYDHKCTRFDYTGWYSFDNLKTVILPCSIERIAENVFDTTREVENDDLIIAYRTSGLQKVILERGCKNFAIKNNKLISQYSEKEIFAPAYYLDEVTNG